MGGEDQVVRRNGMGDGREAAEEPRRVVLVSPCFGEASASPLRTLLRSVANHFAGASSQPASSPT